jgi:hypothetical protein
VPIRSHLLRVRASGRRPPRTLAGRLAGGTACAAVSPPRRPRIRPGPGGRRRRSAPGPRVRGRRIRGLTPELRALTYRCRTD